MRFPVLLGVFVSPWLAGTVAAQGGTWIPDDSASAELPRSAWNLTSLPDDHGGRWDVDREAIRYRPPHGPPKTLRSTDNVGPGPIRDLAFDQHGLLWVAGSQGLYVGSRELVSLDRFEPRGPALPAPPTSLHVDGRNRLWIATEDGLVLCDPGDFSTVVWPRNTLPAGSGPFHVTGQGDELLLRHGDQSYRWNADGGPPPAQPDLHVSFDKGQAGLGPVLLEFPPSDGELRYRIDGHHMWKALPPGARLGQAPGRHVLEVVQRDRLLRSGPPLRLHFVTPRPWYYETRNLTLAFLGGSLGIGLCFYRLGKGLAASLTSTAISVALALQLLAAVFPHAKAWPFVGFSMYSASASADSVAFQPALFGWRGQTWHELRGIYLGRAHDSIWQLIRPLVNGGVSRGREYLAEYNHMRPGQASKALQVRIRRWRLTTSGPVEVAPFVLLQAETEDSHARPFRG